MTREEERDIAAQARDRQMLIQCREHFGLLKAFAEAAGPIRHDGKLIGKAKVIAVEAQAAIDGLTKHMDQREN